ncbi:MAG: hypothetical protein KKF62_01785 [Bacteroidetes bacterium]|nr:hypothetical protein [Bacteroidota bacterium]MBU1116337.1 hypothetical protein [Bacteroidota bacterium]MBU1796910.1 hypothetical protein [Bacteroidota bacterium]
MTVEEYFSLTEQEKISKCQILCMYEDEDREIFNKVEELFLSKFSHLTSIEKVKCGMAPMLGPYNCIKVFIPKSQKRVSLPKYFEGFPTFKILESQYKTYKILLA